MARTKPAPGALAGIKVVDTSTIVAAPFCVEHLGDLGAEVVKIEPMRGDDTRRMGPPFMGDISAHFMGLNRNKKSIAVDLGKPEGRDILLRLLADADIFVENFKPGTLEKWGIGYEGTLKEKFPRLIYCGISGFGETGPWSSYPGFDAAAQAMSGLSAMNGNPEGEPVRMCISATDLYAGLYALSAILAALHERARSGLGQAIDVALFDSALAVLQPFANYWAVGGEAYRPTRTGNFHPACAPYEIFPARDGGMICIAVVNDGQFVGLCRGLGIPDIAEDPRFVDNPGRLKNIEALRAILGPILADQDATELSERLLKANVPAGPVLELPEGFQHEQAKARNMIMEGERYKGIGFAMKMSRTPPALHCPPPYFGEHTRPVLSQLGMADSEIDRLVAAGVVRDRPE